MAKFCGMCGTPLEEGWIACPKCAHRIKQVEETPQKVEVVPEGSVIPEPVMVPETKSADPAPVMQEEPLASYEEEGKKAIKPKKKKKALRITAIVLAVLIVAGSAFGVWWFTRPKFITAGNSTVAFSNKHGDYYNACRKLFNIDCVEDGPIEVELADDFAGNYVDETKSVMVKDSLYAYTGYMDTTEAYGYGKPVDKSKIKYVYGIYKIDFVGETETEAEMWMTYEELSETLDFDFEHANDHSLESFQYSDGYIYCITYEGKLARIRTKDKTAEIIDSDVYSRSYVVNGKWIYFAGTLEEDSEEVGIYKMKTDGSKKELLYELDIAPIDSQLVNLSIYRNRVYFIDSSDSEYNVVCRMTKSGKKVEEIASGDIWAYTIDAKYNKFYFVEQIRLNEKTNNGVRFENKIYETSLGNLSPKHIFSVYDGDARNCILSVCKEKLYFSGDFFVAAVCESTTDSVWVSEKGFSSTYNVDPKPRCEGLVYDIKEKEVYALRRDGDGDYYLEEFE